LKGAAKRISALKQTRFIHPPHNPTPATLALRLRLPPCPGRRFWAVASSIPLQSLHILREMMLFIGT
jgi:hypothetical protein